jgi:hypothetical protein
MRLRQTLSHLYHLRPIRYGALLVLVAAIVDAASYPLWATPSGAATAIAMQRKLHTPYEWRCYSTRNDGTIPMAHINFRCDPRGHPVGWGASYFVWSNHGVIRALLAIV